MNSKPCDFQKLKLVALDLSRAVRLGVVSLFPPDPPSHFQASGAMSVRRCHIGGMKLVIHSAPASRVSLEQCNLKLLNLELLFTHRSRKMDTRHHRERGLASSGVAGGKYRP